MPDEAVRAIVDRVLEVPDAHRVFGTPPNEARRRYGVQAALLDQLIGMGLPHRGRGDDLRCDALDLENVGMALRLPSPQTTIVRQWARSLTGSRLRERGDYELTIHWRCPEPGHAGECEFVLSEALASGTQVVSQRDPAQGFVVLRAAPVDEEHEFDERSLAVLAAVAKLSFHRLPNALSEDLPFLRRTGLADCQLACLHLLRTASELGVVARPACGLFIGVLFPFPHSWVELRVGGRWVPVDPFFLDTLGRWGVVDPEVWPRHRSPRNILWRLRCALWLGEPLVAHHGLEAPVSMSARWLPPG
ncbi:hypothetical protein [Micromonospora sp. NPDC049240]|uniref:hypothetical protein n=1 Tax=Micromonospora sp. NPDC049240 TaxID=3155151 RepID=UPI00341181E5